MPGKIFWKELLPYYEHIPENLKRPAGDFKKELRTKRHSMKATEKEKCKVVLFYLPIVSRAGTDIQAALQKINDDYKGKYVALIVLHNTFDPECVVPDSSRAVKKDTAEIPEKLYVVDCLFYEDKGLLNCNKNDEAVIKVADWLHSVKHKDSESKSMSDSKHTKEPKSKPDSKHKDRESKRKPDSKHTKEPKSKPDSKHKDRESKRKPDSKHAKESKSKPDSDQVIETDQTTASDERKK